MAQLRGGDWSASDDGRAILKGTVPIEYRTTQRTLVLDMSWITPGRWRTATPATRVPVPETADRARVGPGQVVTALA